MTLKKFSILNMAINSKNDQIFCIFLMSHLLKILLNKIVLYFIILFLPPKTLFPSSKTRNWTKDEYFRMHHHRSDSINY